MYTKGYWPKGDSGETIGIGVDIGHNSMSSLVGWGLSAAGQKALAPFVGIHGSSVPSVETANGGHPTISLTDAQHISTGVYNFISNTIAGTFNSQTTTGLTFTQLPAAAQTIIVDVAYNVGPYFPGVAPNFWGAMKSGNFSQAVTELANWMGPGRTTDRLAYDAEYLAQSINQKTTPPNLNNGVCK
jgi:hypothetical protein